MSGKTPLLNASLSRRSFIRNSFFAAGATVVSPLALAQNGGNSQGRGGPHATVTRYPLRIPPVVAPTGALNCAPTTFDLGGGKISTGLGYNGHVPGPTFVARRGDHVALDLYNGLTQPTITHWHGMIVNTPNDGGPELAFEPGTVPYHYDFIVDQRATMNWYHPHPHMMTGEQVNLGLAGAFLIRDDIEDALGLPNGSYEVPLVFRDANFDKQGNLVYNPRSSGFFGKSPMVNGVVSPKLSVDSGFYRFRVLCGANARTWQLALSDGRPFVLIGNDGGLLQSPVWIDEIRMSPGERVDVLVDFSDLITNQKVMLKDLDSGWDLVEFVGTGDPGFAFTVPTTLSTIDPLVGPGSPDRTFSFDGMNRINGMEYEIGRTDFSVPVDTTERWRFTTNGNAPHPVHVHGASFQVVARTGGRNQLYPWEGGWKDTVLLEDQETVDVLIRFSIVSRYVIHCHKLEHEDMGMMSNFEVV